ncbi:MAG TPA: MFS transporter [Candidatus Dormibacteraeota bacterium]
MIESPSYGALLRVGGFPALVGGILFARIALYMLQLELVLFVLRDYRSPTLAGLASFLWIFPGLLISPLAGALLDRYGRVRLIVLDFIVQAAAFCLLGALSLAGLLPAWALLVIVGLASVTSILSLSGGRTLFALMVPPHLWERANAIDSQGYVVATLLGPPLAGVLVGTIGGARALLVTTVLMASAAAAVARVRDVPAVAVTGSLVSNARAGLGYVARSASLRGLAISLTVLNLGVGALAIAQPVLILDRLHQPPVMVGACYAFSAGGGLITGLLAGRLDTRGRERQLLTLCFAVEAAAVLLLPWAGTIWLVFASSALFGAAVGPADIAFFTLRQRRTDPAWFGRVFAISMSLNYAGTPLGSAIAGPLIAWSLTGTLILVACACTLAAALPLALIPAEEPLAVRG